MQMILKDEDRKTLERAGVELLEYNDIYEGCCEADRESDSYL